MFHLQVHITEQSEIAGHCRKYALSDPDDPEFSSPCDHDHNSMCPGCEQLRQLLNDIEVLTEKLSLEVKADSVSDQPSNYKYYQMKDA